MTRWSLGLSWARWASSVEALESDYDGRLRWAWVAENHGYANGRIWDIAARFPLARPERRPRPIVDVPVQLRWEVA